MASRFGVPAKTVKIWYHAGLITGHPYNDKGQCGVPPTFRTADPLGS
jgi:hypothetical protein